jgi:adenylyl cyclase-associated protein
MSLDSAVSSLVSRLEAVTKRLESVEKQLASGVVAAPAAPSGGASGAGAGGASSPSVLAFEELINSYIKPLVKVTNEIGSDELKKQVALVEKAVEAERDFLSIASQSKKPADSDLPALLKPLTDFITQIVELRDKNRVSKQFNHLSTLSEGISALGWVTVSPTPGPFVNESRASSEFYSNKLLVQYKTSDQKQVEWVHNWNNFLKELATYIKQHHTTGLSWNPQGGDAKSSKPAGAAPSPPAAGPPPPPPVSAAPATAKGPDMGALFASINKGEGISSGLKHVPKEKKNKYMDKTALPSGPVPQKTEEKAAAPKAAVAKKGPPKLALEGNKWVVEFQDNNKNIQITETEAKQTVYIYKSDNSVVHISGKINNITLDACRRTGVVFESAISAVELVNCNSVEVQIKGKVPSIAIDKCSGVQLYLSKDTLDVEIVSSKSDQMNVLLPGEGDLAELPIPEQFKTSVVNGKLVTSTVEHV